MSTNFYIIEKKHIGKRVGRERGGTEFLWSMKPYALPTRDIEIMDEYGKLYDYDDFLDEIEDSEHNYNHIGEVFE